MSRHLKTISSALAASLMFISFPIAKPQLSASSAAVPGVDWYPDYEAAKGAWEEFLDRPTSDVFELAYDADLEIYWTIYDEMYTHLYNCYEQNYYTAPEYVMCQRSFTIDGYSIVDEYGADVLYYRFEWCDEVSYAGSIEEFAIARIQAEQIAELQGWAVLSDYDKVMAISEWICDNIIYDDTLENHSLQSALDGLTVCDGYAQLFQVMADYVGLESYIILGEGNGGSHAWNVVNLGGRYYMVDVTWADRSWGVYENEILFGSEFAELDGHVYTTDLNISVDSYSPSIPSIATSTPTPTPTATLTPTNTPTAVPTDSPVRRFVERIYTYVLDRPSDAGGVNYYVNQLVSGRKSGGEIARNFMDSEEFSRRNLNNEQFLRVLYRVFFGREADQGGLNYYLGQLRNGKTRNQIIAIFINSAEWSRICGDYGISTGAITPTPTPSIPANIVDFAKRLYTQCLNRSGDASGINYWATRLYNHTATGTEAAQSFFFSNEFKNSRLGNRVFIARLYRTMYGRNYDQGGMDYWVMLMNNGMTRAQVFANFANSPEWIRICRDYGILK